MVPFLCIGTTTATFQALSTILSLSDLLNIRFKGLTILSSSSFNIIGLILSGPGAAPLLRFLICFLTLFSVIITVYIFFSVSISFAGTLSLFSVVKTLAKNLLSSSAISSSSVIILPSPFLRGPIDDFDLVLDFI